MNADHQGKMIAASVLLVPVLILSLWFFLRLSPKRTKMTVVCLYNAGAVAVGVMICGTMAVRLHSTRAETTDRAWWPVMSTVGSLVLFPLHLAACGFIRNCLLFRPRSGPGAQRG